MMREKVPPHNLDAERAVLGAVMLNPSVLQEAVEIVGLSPSAFYLDAHQNIWAAMLAASGSGKPVDAVVLMDQMTARGTLAESGGIGYLAELTNFVPTSANVQHYARVVADKSTRRDVIDFAATLTRQAFSDDTETEQVLDGARLAIMRMGEAGGQRIDPVSVQDSIDEAVNLIQRDRDSKGAALGLTTGIPQFDELSRGLERGQLFIVGARPSVGKTATGLQFAAAAAEFGGRVLIASLEMSAAKLTRRMIYSIGRIDSRRVRKDFASNAEMAKIGPAVNRLSNADISMLDYRASTPGRIRTAAQRHKMRNGLDLLIVDHFHLLSPDRPTKNEVADIAQMSRALKMLAEELDVCVLLLAQLNRDASGNRATMKDLRGGGSLEQDADKVLLLTAVADLSIKGDERAKLGGDEGVIFHLVKNRDDETGQVICLFKKSEQRFVVLGVPEYEPEPAAHAYDPSESFDEFGPEHEPEEVLF